MDCFKPEIKSDVMLQKAEQDTSNQIAKRRTTLLAFSLPFSRASRPSRHNAVKHASIKKCGPCSVARGVFGFYRNLFLSLRDQNLLIHASEEEIDLPVLCTIHLVGATLTVTDATKFTIRSSKRNYWFKLRTKAERDGWLRELRHVTGLLRKASDFYVDGHKCGEGATCVVQKCFNRLTGNACAVKTRIDPFDEIGRHGMYNELRILQILAKNPHPSIPVLEDYFFDKTGDIKIAMEFMNRGELLDMIDQQKGMQEDMARDLFSQIAEGIYHLHRNCIAHRDIKPSNIMIVQRPDGKLQCKIIDYDLAKENYADQWVAHNPCGTAEFMAPEILENKLYTQAVDIWSLGCVLYGMLIGRCPFRGANYQETRRNILNNRIQVADLNAVSADAKDLICKMLESCPERRLSAKEVLEHPWLHSLN